MCAPGRVQQCEEAAEGPPQTAHRVQAGHLDVRRPAGQHRGHVLRLRQPGHHNVTQLQLQ